MTVAENTADERWSNGDANGSRKGRRESGGRSGEREGEGRGEAGTDKAGVGRGATPWAPWWGEPCGAANAAVGMGEREEVREEEEEEEKGRRYRRGEESRVRVQRTCPPPFRPVHLFFSFSISASLARCGKYAARVAARRRRIGRAEAPSRGI